MTGDMRSSLTVLAAAVGFMLLIAGANLGTLLVASGASRAREFAVRAAIGASRGSLVRLQLIEGLMLAAAGAVAGLALACGACRCSCGCCRRTRRAPGTSAWTAP